MILKGTRVGGEGQQAGKTTHSCSDASRLRKHPHQTPRRLTLTHHQPGHPNQLTSLFSPNLQSRSLHLFYTLTTKHTHSLKMCIYTPPSPDAVCLTTSFDQAQPKTAVPSVDTTNSSQNSQSPTQPSPTQTGTHSIFTMLKTSSHSNHCPALGATTASSRMEKWSIQTLSTDGFQHRTTQIHSYVKENPSP